MTKSYSEYKSFFPEYSKYFDHDSAYNVAHAVHYDKGVKALIKIAEKGIHSGKASKDSKLERLVDYCLKMIEEHDLSIGHHGHKHAHKHTKHKQKSHGHKEKKNEFTKLDLKNLKDNLAGQKATHEAQAAQAAKAAEAKRAADAAIAAELARQAEAAKIAEAAKAPVVAPVIAPIVDPAQALEAARIAEVARQAEAARVAEVARSVATAKAAEEARIAEAARQAEAAKVAEVARSVATAKAAEEARIAEAARQAEAARAAEAVHIAAAAKAAEEARVAEAARQAEAARAAEAARIAAAAKAAEEARIAEAAKQAAIVPPIVPPAQPVDQGGGNWFANMLPALPAPIMQFFGGAGSGAVAQPQPQPEVDRDPAPADGLQPKDLGLVPEALVGAGNFMNFLIPFGAAAAAGLAVGGMALAAQGQAQASPPVLPGCGGGGAIDEPVVVDDAEGSDEGEGDDIDIDDVTVNSDGDEVEGDESDDERGPSVPSDSYMLLRDGKHVYHNPNDTYTDSAGNEHPMHKYIRPFPDDQDPAV